MKGVVILPDGDLGNRVGAAFADEFTHLGGTVLDSGRYDAGRADFSDVIKQTLQIHGPKGEAPTHRTMRPSCSSPAVPVPNACWCRS